MRGPPSTTLVLGGAYLLAGAGVAAARATTPFAHGWWLVAYLVLVGGAAQLLLGLGALHLLRPATEAAGGAGSRTGLALWNAGVPLVPVGVLTGTPGWVGLGGLLELLALGLLGTAVAAPAARSQLAGRRLATALYLALVAGLAFSVVIGMRLGDALPR